MRPSWVPESIEGNIRTTRIRVYECTDYIFNNYIKPESKTTKFSKKKLQKQSLIDSNL